MKVLENVLKSLSFGSCSINSNDFKQLSLTKVHLHMGRVYSDLTDVYEGLEDLYLTSLGALKQLGENSLSSMKQFGENLIIQSSRMAGAYAVIPEEYTEGYVKVVPEEIVDDIIQTDLGFVIVPKQQETLIGRAQAMWNSIEWNKATEFVVSLPGAYVTIPNEYSEINMPAEEMVEVKEENILIEVISSSSEEDDSEVEAEALANDIAELFAADKNYDAELFYRF